EQLSHQDRLAFVRATNDEMPMLVATLDTALTRVLATILSEVQQAGLQQLLGAPYSGGKFPGIEDASPKAGPGLPPRGCTVQFGVGRFTAPPSGMVESAEFQKALSLSDEQIEKIKSPEKVFAEVVPDGILSPEQYQRATELSLQAAQQMYGPIGPFRY